MYTTINLPAKGSCKGSVRGLGLRVYYIAKMGRTHTHTHIYIYIYIYIWILNMVFTHITIPK